MIARRIFLVSLVALAGCAIFDAPPDHITVRDGFACTGTVEKCAEFAMIARDLSSPAMHDAICAAGADTAECRK